MFKHYTTIANLIKCGLATEEELVQAYAVHTYKTGKELPVPKIITQTVMDYREKIDTGSDDYKFYLEVHRAVYKKHIAIQRQKDWDRFDSMLKKRPISTREKDKKALEKLKLKNK